MSVDIKGHHDRSVAEPRLHYLGGQLLTAVLTSIDEPRRIEMPKRVQPGIFRSDDRLALRILGGLALFVQDRGCQPSGEHHGVKLANDVRMMLNVANSGWEHEVIIVLGTGELPFLQGIEHKGAERDGALCRF